MLPTFPPFDYHDPAVLQSHLREALPFLHRLVFDKMLEIARDEDLTVYLVGGIVRDLFLGRPNSDLDFVVLADAHRLARIAGAVFKTLLAVQSVKLTVHTKFGTARLDLVFQAADDSSPSHIHVDIATARLETYAHPAALPDVTFPATLVQDLRRRDFSINAIAVAPVSGGLQLTDPFDGLADLKAGWLRVLHPLSLVDDPTRILRGVRFAARFDYRFEPATASLLQKAVADGYLPTLSPERIRNELLLILREARPEIALQLLADYKILSQINPLLAWQPEWGQDFRQLRQLLATSISPAAYLALLCYRLEPTQVQKIGRDLRLFDQNQTVPFQVAQLWHTVRPALSSPLVNSQLYRLLHPFTPYALEVGAALLQIQGLGEAAARVRYYLDALQAKKPQLDGEDLKRLGLKPGPQFGQILEALHAALLDGLVVTRADEEAFVQQQLAALP